MSPPVPKTDVELEKLARDIIAGLVFTDRHIADTNTDNIPLVFVPLSMLSPMQLESLREAKPAMFYEYLNRALPRVVNGLPRFASFKYLTKDEAERFGPIYERVRSETPGRNIDVKG